MAIDLMCSETVVTIEDNVRGGSVTYKMRLPTTEERVRYMAGLFKNEGDALAVDLEHKAKCASELLTGFTDGSFELDGKEISSDRTSKNYYPDWKSYIEKNFNDHLNAIAGHVFERVSAKKKVYGFGKN